MADIGNSFLNTYTISSTLYESMALPSSYNGNVLTEPSPLVVTVLPMQDIILQTKIGDESSRQTWS